MAVAALAGYRISTWTTQVRGHHRHYNPKLYNLRFLRFHIILKPILHNMSQPKAMIPDMGSWCHLPLSGLSGYRRHIKPFPGTWRH